MPWDRLVSDWRDEVHTYLTLAEQLCFTDVITNNEAAIIEARGILFEPLRDVALVRLWQEVGHSTVRGRSFYFCHAYSVISEECKR